MPVAEAKVVPRLKERYEAEIKQELQSRFGYSSPMQVPRLTKIVVNMGVGDAKQDTRVLEQATEQLATIAGQRPSVRRARKSIAAFKLRDGMPVGVAVTLRGARMWEFLDRLVSIALPRIRDFRGLNPGSFDGRGNYSLGVREQIIFPEIDYDAIDEVRGLDVTIATTAATDAEAFALLSALGMPFAREGRPEVPGGDMTGATGGDGRVAPAAEQSAPVPDADEHADRTEAELAGREELQEEVGTDATPEGPLATAGEPDGAPAGGEPADEATGQDGGQEPGSSGTDSD
jgi:large subunit ribosomal protein L5